MLPVIALGPVMISTFGIFIVLAFVAASFLLWRGLREDYPEEEIISLTIFLTLVAFLAGRLFYILGHLPDFGWGVDRWLFWTRFPGFSLPGAFWGMVLLAFWWSRKKNWDFWVVADGAVWALLTTLLLGSFGAWLSDGATQTLAKTILAVLLFPLVFYLSRNFRKFIWYKSGKPGFVICSLVAFYFLGFAGLDFWFKTGIYLNLVTGLAISGSGLFFLYRRSERKIQQDIASLSQLMRNVRR